MNPFLIDLSEVICEDTTMHISCYQFGGNPPSVENIYLAKNVRDNKLYLIMTSTDSYGPKAHKEEVFSCEETVDKELKRLYNEFEQLGRQRDDLSSQAGQRVYDLQEAKLSKKFSN